MPSESKPLGREQWYVLAAAFLGWMFDGLEQGLFPLAARPALRYLMPMASEAEVGVWYSRLVALFLLGAAAGGLVFGWLGDKLGRVRSMALSIAVYSVFTGCCYFATQPWHLGVFRFLAAVGMGGEWALGVALVMECWPERHRPMLAGAIGAASNVGFLLIAVVAVCFAVTEESWRWIMLAGAVPGVLTFFILALIPESKRWQQSVEKAASRPIREIFTTRLAVPTILGVLLASVALIGTWAAVSGFLPVWGDQLAGGDRTLPVTLTLRDSASAGMDLVSVESVKRATATDNEGGTKYTLKKTHDLTGPAQPAQTFTYKFTVTNNGTHTVADVRVTDRLLIDLIDPLSVKLAVKDQGADASFNPDSGELTWNVRNLEHKNPHAKAWIQFVLAIGAIIGSASAALLANAIGRRPTYFILCLLSLLSCAFLFRCFTEYGFFFVAMTGFVGLVTASFYGWFPLYLPELFPTRVRATGQGLSYNTGRIFRAAGALGTGQLTALFGGYPQACATITLVYIVGMIVIWFAPETKGKPLPE